MTDPHPLLGVESFSRDPLSHALNVLKEARGDGFKIGIATIKVPETMRFTIEVVDDDEVSIDFVGDRPTVSALLVTGAVEGLVLDERARSVHVVIDGLPDYTINLDTIVSSDEEAAFEVDHESELLCEDHGFESGSLQERVVRGMLSTSLDFVDGLGRIVVGYVSEEAWSELLRDHLARNYEPKPRNYIESGLLWLILGQLTTIVVRWIMERVFPDLDDE